MTVRSRTQIQLDADIIRDETVRRMNTPERVGGLMRDMSDSFALISDIPSIPEPEDGGLQVAGDAVPGYFIRADALGAAYWGTDASYNITSFSTVTTLVQVGGTLTTPAFTAVHTVVPTSLALTDSAGTPSKNVVGSPGSFTSDGIFTKVVPNQTVVFTLTGSDGITPAVSNRTVTWVNRIYYGTKVPATFNGAFVTGLPGNALQASGNKTFVETSGATEHKYFAFPTRLGTATVVIGGFTYSWTVIATNISVTNSDGYAENYTLIENENLGVGQESIAVTVS